MRGVVCTYQDTLVHEVLGLLARGRAHLHLVTQQVTDGDVDQAILQVGGGGRSSG